jgi:hypothetical protein
MAKRRRTKKRYAHHNHKMKLEELLVKNLVQDIESSGKTRNGFNLHKLVEDRSYTYGEAGSEKQRAVQKKVDLLKRKTPQQYLKFLDKIGVNPGEGTKREIRESKENEEDKDESESGSESGSGSGSGSSSGSDSDYSDSESTKKSKKSQSTKKSKSTPKQTKPASKQTKPATPVKTKSPEVTPEKITKVPPQKISFIGSSPIISPPIISIPTMASVSSIESSDTAAVILKQVIDQVHALEKIKQDGSADFPYVIIADPSKPEANNGFEVSLVKGVEFRNFTRSVYYIRRTTAVPQVDEWSAMIPLKKYPSLAKRAVLIRGPSQDFWNQKASRYHQNQFCDKTKVVHQTLETQISGEPTCKISYWLIVLPSDTVLENHILSDDAEHVKTERPMTWLKLSRLMMRRLSC